ncbi:hypothetical protein RBH94_15010 [Aestuariibaculum sp. YM273]|uniref:hypothetical protein n=1 Tax=Aestuariibaculum sp. YM273 TaxID=3070659 RepID=UPI0027DD1FE4|nr:hypothetical protein [Aestuariibaculum sp. YM273]WMI65361.1 hypothetical protein RBH94_15010 [Aestuariibaculum sp. YM273]
MKKQLLSILSLFILCACSSSKQIEKSLSTGNYDQAIYDALNKLRTNKDKKGKAEYIVMLHEAYNKATERDLGTVDFLKQDNNPENYIRIYDTYVNLDNRQERIKPVLPLYVNGREVKFDFNDYSSHIISFKNDASQQMYKTALNLLDSKNKLDFRQAYNDFKEIETINPNFKDVRQLMDVAHSKGTDFVLVDMVNDTEKVIPQRLEDDLLNFSTYGLNNLWTVYHNTPVNEVNYDYNMRVNLRGINISPEQIKERQIIKEKQIIDGKKDLLDDNGYQVKDSLGNVIKIDNLKTVRCEYYESTQFKSVQVTGNVEYVNLNTKQLEDAFPITSEFVFQHIFATSRGDRRALETDLLQYLNNQRVPFPSESQMIYDTGEDLKAQLKQIINSYSIR